MKQLSVKRKNQLSVEDLTTVKWNFGYSNGSLLSQVKLLPNGEIQGYSNPNEASWALVEGILVFYNKKGKPSTRFTSCLRDNKKVFFTGQFLLGKKKIFHVFMSPWAFEIGVKLPAKFYVNLGNSFQEQERWEEAIACYQKVIKLHPEKDRSYHALGQAYMDKGDWKNAISSYQLAINHNGMELRLTDFSDLNNPDYFKFVVLRNPFDKLVSAYLHKFVRDKQPVSITLPVIKNVYQFLRIESISYEKGITFSQFIHYLARTTNDLDLDSHWRPQHTFLGLGLFKKFDYVGQFEKLDAVIEYLENKFGFTITKDDVSKP